MHDLFRRVAGEGLLLDSKGGRGLHYLKEGLTGKPG